MSTVAAWRARAACRSMDTDIFFRAIGRPARQVVQACQACPVREQCLTFALSTPYDEDYGYWGGATQKERRKMRRAQKEES